MSKTKHKRHHKTHDHHKQARAAEVEASGDVLDLESASAASKDQRDDYDEADGANIDTGQPELANETAHIIAANATAGGAGCEIVINRGLDDGVVEGMAGHIKGDDGVLGEFIVHRVGASNCTALASDTPYKDIQTHKTVVLNPSGRKHGK